MDYDVEREKRKSEDIRKVFRELFPLAAEEDLPWAPAHIKQFLRNRIRKEVEEGVHHFTTRVVRVLCEVSPPKTHVDDMARIAVDQAKASKQWEIKASSYKEEMVKLHETIKQSFAAQQAFFRDALEALAGIVPTPELGYSADGNWSQLLADIKTLRKLAEARTSA